MAAKAESTLMIFIVVKFTARPAHADHWLERVQAFTQATRSEPGNLWFEWSRSVDVANQFVLVEAFEDDAAEAHVNSDHFTQGLEVMRPMLEKTPEIVNGQVPGTSWSEMGELTV